jgi:hypothetical protein
VGWSPGAVRAPVPPILPSPDGNDMPGGAVVDRTARWDDHHGLVLRATELPRPVPDSFRRLVRLRLPVHAFWIAAAALVAARAAELPPWTLPALDLHTYWSTRFGIDYAGWLPGEIGAYLYAPAFAQAISPLASLPWPWFAAAWTALIAGAVAWLAGRWALPLLSTVVVALELYLGQVDVMLGAAIVLGFRWPAAWALPLLTKVTPGVGLLWFAARGEWGALARVAGGTAAIVAVSVAIGGAEPWLGWVGLLARSLTHPAEITGLDLAVPLWVRLPAAAALVVWGARTDRPWSVPAAATLAMPILWLNVFSMLIAVVPLRAEGGPVPARCWLRRSRELRPALLGR